MKRLKVILGIICIMLLLVGCGKKKVDESLSGMITIDINPSIEIEVKDNKANRIGYNGGEAEELISRDFEGKPLTEAFEEIVKNAMAKGYEEDGALTIILGIEDAKANDGKDAKSFEDLLKEACVKNDITFDIIVPEITEEAKREAEGYGVSPAKAAVILEAMKDNEDLHFDDLKDKSAKELRQMKETGLYCDREYTLRGDKCERIEREEKPQEGSTCPEGAFEYNGKCYQTTKAEGNDELSCPGKEKNGKCYVERTLDAKVTCATGTYNSGSGKCELSELAGEGTKSCNKTGDPGDQMMSNGRCSRGKWAHDDNTCEGADVFIADKSGGPNAGWCYNPSGDYDANVTCPSGQTVKDGKCYKVSSSDATFTCDSGYTLNGKKCVKEEETEFMHKMVYSCPSGLKMVDNNKCIDESKAVEKVKGLTCSKDARLEGERCVYYEVVDAKGK